VSVTRRGQEHGFTLLELLVVMSIAGTLALIGGFGFVNYRSLAQQRGSTQELTSFLRNVSERSVSEGRTFCVDLAAGGQSYTLWQYACTAATGSQLPGMKQTQSPKVAITATVSSPLPSPPCPASDTCLYFYPRGTAVPATLRVASTVRPNVYVVHVEGLTARVY